MHSLPRKKGFPLGRLAVCCALLLALAAGPAQAVSYTVDSSLGASADPDFKTLDELRIARSPLADGDSITFYNSDNTLGGIFFGLPADSRLTLGGNGSGLYTMHRQRVRPDSNLKLTRKPAA